MKIAPHIAEKASLWLEVLSSHSTLNKGVKRTAYSPEHRKTNQSLKEWMESIGMTVRQDNAGNLIGRYASPNADTKTLLLGSHQDSGPQNGHYEGALGIVVPLAALTALHEKEVTLPYHVDLVALSDGEGLRFPEESIGSRAITGSLSADDLQCRDEEGVSLRDALIGFGGSPTAIAHDAYDPESVLGFVEVYIEQGPVLKEKDLPLGVVSGIASNEQYTVTVKGETGHAGAIPMTRRQDTLLAASHMIHSVDDILKSTPNTVGVVGSIENHPNIINVIPEKTVFTIDFRAEKDEVRTMTRERILESLTSIAERLNVDMEITCTAKREPASCDNALTDMLRSTIASNDITPHTMFSGAGHEGLAMKDLTDVAMLFVRCEESSAGLESAVSINDIEKAVEIIATFLNDLDVDRLD
jgi:allantoate deiminase